jgi:alkylhydroperoxidase family enzyme
MAFLAFNEPGMAGVARASIAATAPVRSAPVADPAEAVPAATLTDLERSVIAIARHDRVSTLRTPGRASRWLALLFGLRSNPRLADDRLEALRRIAVLSWRHGYAVPAVELRAFLAAGYSPAQYELVVDRINDARIAGNGRVAFA